MLIAIPIALLFVVASQLGANYIDRFFTPQFRAPIESSIEVAKTVYESERQHAMDAALMVKAGKEPPVRYKVLILDTVPEVASSSIRSAFKGEPATEVLSKDEGDTIYCNDP